MQETSNRNVLIGIVVTAVLVFGGLVWAIVSAPPSTPVSGGPLSFEDAGDPFIGPENATTVVRLFSDFQCPACRAAEAGVNYAIEKYKSKVKFIWNDFPLMSIHPNARLAANAARCAQDQGQFWEMKDKLYTEQTSWATGKDPAADFKAYAGQLGLDAGTFGTCLDSTLDHANLSHILCKTFLTEVLRPCSTPDFSSVSRYRPLSGWV
ncbi:DsbA family protein [Candidatus Uhrbacteria bacterium]|nr:DsbA family protein [Candidatus Uhrbacteria bacterium]